jgi:prophage regulatory protein
MSQTIIGCKELCRLLGKSRTTIWRWERDGRFPQRVQTGPNSVAWLLQEIQNWIAARAAERRSCDNDSSPALAGRTQRDRTMSKIRGPKSWQKRRPYTVREQSGTSPGLPSW